MFLSVLLNQYYASGIIYFGSGSNKNEKADKLKIMKVASRLTFYNTVYKTIWRIFTKNNWHRLFPPHLHGLITIIVRGFSGPRLQDCILNFRPVNLFGVMFFNFSQQHGYRSWQNSNPDPE